MPSVSKKQQKFMGIVRSIQKGEQPASKFSKKAQDVAKNMKRKDVKKYASTKHKNLESILSENPIVAATVMQMTKMQMKNPKTGKSVKASTPLRDKSHPLHKKSKSLFQRIKDKLSRKKDKPKKQSKADVDFYKKQYTGESVNEAGMELKKLEDAIKMFQKKIDKQGRVTNARDEDHLKNLIKIYKQMGGKGIREAMDKRQGAETLKQLGGNRFIMMTGAKHFGVGPNGMSFKIGKNSKRVNHVTIDYDRGRDLYNMKFDWVTIKGIKNKKTLKGIYADQLQDMFTKYTGMYTSL